MFCPATVQERPSAGTQGPEGPSQPSLPFLPAQFLFLVLRYCDERRLSSHTSCVRLGGAGPPTAASLRPPAPHTRPFLGPELQEQAEERRPPAPATQLEALWAVRTWLSADACPPCLPPGCCCPWPWPAPHLVLTQALHPVLASRAVHATGRLEGGVKKTLRAPLLASRDSERSQGRPVVPLPGRAGGSSEAGELRRLQQPGGLPGGERP